MASEEVHGKRMRADEAGVLWNRIVDHKLFVSERLGRDVGVRVAAIDFLDNIYDENAASGRQDGRMRLRMLSASNSAVAG